MCFKETELGRIPAEWDIDTMENSLDSIIDYRGKTPEKSDEGIKTLSAKSVKDGYIDYDLAYHISSDTYKNFMVRGMPKKGDILMTTEAPLGLVAKLDRDNVALAQRLLTLRGKSNYLENNYLMYYLKSKIGQHQLNIRASGTTVSGIKQSEFRKVLIILPPIKEQKVISKILSDLDEKIEVNNKINKKLEEMAQSIFKQWFVDFEFPNEDGEPYKSSGGEMIESELGMVPKGWRYGEICDVAKRIYSGGTPKTSEESYWNGDLPWMSSGETRNNFVISTDKNISKLGAEKSSTKLAYKYNTVIASAGQGFTRGQTSLLLIDTYINQSLITIESKKDYEFFNYLNIKSRYNELRSISDSHSIRGSLTTKMIGSLSIIIPAELVANQFSNLVFLIINKIENNIKEIDRLIKIRDLLLPKLMSGEIRVPINN